MKIKIEYDGEYPNLCRGHLFITIDGKKWDFGTPLSSGGQCYFENGYKDSVVTKGRWEITKFPERFPQELKNLIEAEVNAEIPWGCCGGCL